MTDAPTTPDPIEIAMEAEAHDRAPDSPARELLRAHLVLARQQMLAQRLGNLLRLAAGLAGLAVVALAGLLVWQASQADGLVVKPFSVPPEFAARGVTGEAVASQLLDRLSQINEQAWTTDRPRRVSADWGDNIAIEIPQTGVSISQLEQWLREKLGHQTRLTGELMLGPDGRLRLAARVGSDVLPPQEGAAAHLDAMVQKTAEAIFAKNQPRSYDQYLYRTGRLDEAEALARGEIASADAETRAWGHAMLANILQRRHDPAGAYAANRRAQLLAPEAGYGLNNLSIAEWNLGHSEEGVRLTRRLLEVRRQLGRDADAAAQRDNVAIVEARLGNYVGDPVHSLALAEGMSRRVVRGFEAGAAVPLNPMIFSLAVMHESARARAALADADPARLQGSAGLATRIDYLAENWEAVLADYDHYMTQYAMDADQGRSQLRFTCMYKALPLVRLNRLPEAAAVVADTPLNAEPCVRARGLLAEASGNRVAADRSYAQAVRLAPSVPTAALEWGQVKLARGDAAGAIAAFATANKIAPRFADPLEGWGEALLVSGDAKGAAAKFAQGSHTAPNWGRLHIKWGEALAKLGKAEAARTHWQTAAGLDLTAAERAELARVSK